MNTIRHRMTNSIKWSAASIGLVLFFIATLVINGWLSLQLLVLLFQR